MPNPTIAPMSSTEYASNLLSLKCRIASFILHPCTTSAYPIPYSFRIILDSVHPDTPSISASSPAENLGSRYFLPLINISSICPFNISPICHFSTATFFSAHKVTNFCKTKEHKIQKTIHCECTTLYHHSIILFPVKMKHHLPSKRYAPYRLLGMEHTGICGMGHTVSAVNSKVADGFANDGCRGHSFICYINRYCVLIFIYMYLLYLPQHPLLSVKRQYSQCLPYLSLCLSLSFFFNFSFSTFIFSPFILPSLAQFPPLSPLLSFPYFRLYLLLFSYFLSLLLLFYKNF